MAVKKSAKKTASPEKNKKKAAPKKAASSSPKKASKATPPAQKSKVGDEAILKATGKTWDQWIALIEKAGGRKKNHKELVAFLSEKHSVKPWWRQMITVGYEQSVGSRVLHQKVDGYEVSAGKTIAVSDETVFQAWLDEKIRNQWLGETVTIRKATPYKSMRVTWSDGDQILSLNFYSKGPDKCQVTVQHTKLKNAKEAAKMKKYWQEKVEELKSFLEN